MLPPQSLLQDADGDGFPDSLRGTLYLSEPLTLAVVRAAAELTNWLASDALILPLNPRLFSAPQPTIYIGEQPPENLLSTTRGASAALYPDALLLTAATDADLFSGALQLRHWPLEQTLGLLARNSLSPAALIRLEFQNGLVTLHCSEDFGDVPDWDALPTELKACVTPTARYENPSAVRFQSPSHVPPPQMHFGLAQAFRGGGLFTGSTYAPKRFQGKVSIETSRLDVLGVVSRLSTEGLETPAVLTGGVEDASVRLLVDKAHGAEVRVQDGEHSSVLEVAGGTPADFERAAAFVAREFPYLPDGTDLEKLEADLKAFLQGETPLGRVAQLAALQKNLGLKATHALLPHPPPAAPRLLGLPVKNSARDGERQHWQVNFKWEGARLFESLAALTWTPGDSVVIEGYLSESQAVRKALQTRTESFLKGQQVTAHVLLRSAYKPGLCWLLEEVGPQLTSLAVTELHVQCKIQRQGREPEDRWLRELYPVATLLERTYHVPVTLGLVDSQATYRVLGLASDGCTVFEDSLTPPTLEAPSGGTAAGGFVYPTTGHLSVRRGSQTLLEESLPTDRDLFWAWFRQTVLPEVTHGVAPGVAGPYFGELSVVASLSEPDVSLNVDHEQLSATESLHEDIYFGTLEALHEAAGLDAKDRSLTPGRVLPFCTAAEAQDTAATVMLRSKGSYKLGLVDRAGTWHEALRSPISISTRAIRLPPDAAPHVMLELTVADKEAAQAYSTQLEWGRDHRKDLGVWDPFPQGSRLTVDVKVSGQQVRTVEIPEYRRPVRHISLPERPLLTREVTTYAEQFSRTFPQVYLRPFGESQQGAPLVALELTSSPYASRARLASWKPSVLISARQHANEPTSTNAMFAFLEKELAQNDLLKKVNIVFHPLENPDGARLHAALCQLSARHMHHAARYTGCGADLQGSPQVYGRLIPESALRHETGRRWKPWLHLNCHGYPAHEWVRANSGYIPRGFEAWSLPFGYFTILSSTSPDAALLERLKGAVGTALRQRAHLHQTTQAQVYRAMRHTNNAFPFVLEQGFPFLLSHEQPVDQTDDQDFAPRLAVITEVPDETVAGPLWRNCVEAQQIIVEAALQTCLKVEAAAL